jgi:hypothetical protein
VFADSTTASFQRSEIVGNIVVSQPGNGSEAGGLDLRGSIVTIPDSTIAGNQSVQAPPVAPSSCGVAA